MYIYTIYNITIKLSKIFFVHNLLLCQVQYNTVATVQSKHESQYLMRRVTDRYYKQTLPKFVLDTKPDHYLIMQVTAIRHQA